MSDWRCAANKWINGLFDSKQGWSSVFTSKGKAVIAEPSLPRAEQSSTETEFVSSAAKYTLILQKTQTLMKAFNFVGTTFDFSHSIFLKNNESNAWA